MPNQDVPTPEEKTNPIPEELKDDVAKMSEEHIQRMIRLARSCLSGRAIKGVGVSAVAHSALASVFQKHLDKIDFQNQDSIWYILCRATFRHCSKWNARFRRHPLFSLEEMKAAHDNAPDMSRGLDPGSIEPTPEEEVVATELFNKLVNELEKKRLGQPIVFADIFEKLVGNLDQKQSADPIAEGEEAAYPMPVKAVVFAYLFEQLTSGLNEEERQVLELKLLGYKRMKIVTELGIDLTTVDEAWKNIKTLGNELAVAESAVL